MPHPKTIIADTVNYNTPLPIKIRVATNIAPYASFSEKSVLEGVFELDDCDKKNKK